MTTQQSAAKGGADQVAKEDQQVSLQMAAEALRKRRPPDVSQKECDYRIRMVYGY